MADDEWYGARRRGATEQEDASSEAEERLDVALVEHRWLFPSDRFAYALARARLADRRGDRDEAAAFAEGAAWQLASDRRGPALARHPDVGRIGADGEVEGELVRLIAAGDAEAFSPIVDEFRSADDGRVRWEWPLVLRLRTSPNDPRRVQQEAERRLAAPMLRELREAGLEIYDASSLSSTKLPSRAVAEVLVRWIRRIDVPWIQAGIASVLTSPKARPVATEPLLELFGELPDGAGKERVAAALGTLVRDTHFARLAALIRDPRHRPYAPYLFWAVGYVKDPGAVDLCLELLDDDELGMSALRALADLRAERARPVLAAIAGTEAPRGRSAEALRARDRIRVAQNGLGKLDRARG